MPSSKGPCPPVRLTPSFWAGLVAGLFVLSAFAGFNIVIDPTGEFGLSGRHSFNRAPPPTVVASGKARGNPAFFARAIRESDAKYFLIGSSRTRRGFDTCGLPDVLVLSGSAWALPEQLQVQRLVLVGRKKPATLLMEVGLPTTLPPVIDDPGRAALSVALSPRTTLQALETVAHSLSNKPIQPTYTACRDTNGGEAPNWHKAAVEARHAVDRLDASPQAILRQQATLLAMADLADQICVKEGLRHTVVFYTLPSTPSGSPGAVEAGLFNRNSERLARVFELRPAAPGGCKVQFLNLASIPPGPPGAQALWRSRENWLDYTHFSPGLGAWALEVLLKN